MKKQRSSVFFTVILLLGDILAIIGAYSLAYILRVKISDNPVANPMPASTYFYYLLSLTPFIVMFLVVTGTYRSSSQKVLSQFLRIIIASLVTMLSLVTIDYFLNDPLFPAKLVPVYGLILSVVLLIIARSILYTGRWLWWHTEKNLLSVVIVGGDYAARDLAEDIQRRNSGYKLIGVVGDQRFSFTTHRTFAEAVKHKKPDLIIQIASPKTPTVDQDLVDYAISHYAELKFVPNDVIYASNAATIELFMGDTPVIDIKQTSLTGWGRLIKRLFDLVVAGLALIILSPILLTIAIINRFMFGKTIFGQTRLTRGNRKFKLYKFQTVRKDLNGLTPEEAFTKIGRPELIKQYRDNGDFLADDPRYGGWSKFLRKTSLDELPQLWNVIKGDISLVGPRALIPEELNTYNDKHLILAVRSGITGLAQISGRRGLPWDQRRKLDIYYAQNWTFALDIKILVSTAWQVLTGRGAE